MLALLFILFAGLAIGCGLAVVAQRNPLYSAISLVGVFISLACLYVMLAAPFIAAVQVIVYAGAIMVLVVFVIMLLNVEQEERGRNRLKFLVPAAVVGVTLNSCTETSMKATSAIRTAASATAVGTKNLRRARPRSSCSTLSSMITKTTSTIMAPAYTITWTAAMNGAASIT